MRPSALAETIADQKLRAAWYRLCGILRTLHSDVDVVENSVEMRAESGGRLLCRVVPYRELLHVLVGSDPTWEARIRDADGFREAVDRILRAWLRERAGASPREARTTRSFRRAKHL